MSPFDILSYYINPVGLLLQPLCAVQTTHGSPQRCKCLLKCIHADELLNAWEVIFKSQVKLCLLLSRSISRHVNCIKWRGEWNGVEVSVVHLSVLILKAFSHFQVLLGEHRNGELLHHSHARMFTAEVRKCMKQTFVRRWPFLTIQEIYCLLCKPELIVMFIKALSVLTQTHIM
jgi:hypothetical protein